MIRFLLLVPALLLSLSAAAQSDPQKAFDHAAEFPGGLQGLQDYLRISMRYPEKAKNDKAEGRVQVRFDVNENGSVGAIKVMNPIHPSLDSEAVRVVKGMPNWKPATLDNKNVKVSMVLPVVFALDDKKGK
ncbi:MAG: energy transducer TonB [Chitinophagaceae bacterium]|nr:energy transducer TonB [Chitinophagaceae bacterium]